MTETPGPRRRSPVPWVIAGAVIVGALVGGGVVFALTSGGDPTSVQDVADQAVEAADDLDVDAGIDLLCSVPGEEDRDILDTLISDARDATGTDSPSVTYDVSEVDGGETGSFLVTITSDEPDLAGQVGEVKVEVSRDGDRSCISGWDASAFEQDGAGDAEK